MRNSEFFDMLKHFEEVLDTSNGITSSMDITTTPEINTTLLSTSTSVPKKKSTRLGKKVAAKSKSKKPTPISEDEDDVDITEGNTQAKRRRPAAKKVLPESEESSDAE